MEVFSSAESEKGVVETMHNLCSSGVNNCRNCLSSSLCVFQFLGWKIMILPFYMDYEECSIQICVRSYWECLVHFVEAWRGWSDIRFVNFDCILENVMRNFLFTFFFSFLSFFGLRISDNHDLSLINWTEGAAFSIVKMAYFVSF